MTPIIQSKTASAPAKRTPVTIVRVHGKPFVAGLYWQPLSNPRSLLQEARQIGKREAMDFVVIRRGNLLQAGFVEKGRGALSGMFSLAAVLASRLGKNWVGVISLGDSRFALCAVHDGGILPGCDVVGPHDEILEKFKRTHCMFNWDATYVPPGFTNAIVGEELDLAKLLATDLSKEARLQALSFNLTRAQTIGVGVAVALAVATAGGYMQWASMQKAKVQAEQLRIQEAKQRELDALNAVTQKQQTAVALEHPWTKRPAVDALLKACGDGINRLPLYLGGWQFENAKCDGHSTVVGYRRVPNATVADFAKATRERLSVEAVIGANNDVATVTLPIEINPGGDDPILPSAARIESFVAHFQRAGIVYKLSEVVPPPPPAQSAALPGNKNVPPPPPPPLWKTYTWGYETEQSPAVSLAGLDTTGIRISALSVTMRSDAPSPLNWTISGDLYAQP